MKDKMIKIGKILDIPEGEGRVFRLNDSEIAIFRLESEIQGSSGPNRQGPSGLVVKGSRGVVGADLCVCPDSKGEHVGSPLHEPSNPGTLEPSPFFVAIDNRCPHQNGPLADGIVAGDLVICPLHGHKFNLRTGESIGDDGRIKTYTVLVDKEEIFIENDPIM